MKEKNCMHITVIKIYNVFACAICKLKLIFQRAVTKESSIHYLPRGVASALL